MHEPKGSVLRSAYRNKKVSYRTQIVRQHSCRQ